MAVLVGALCLSIAEVFNVDGGIAFVVGFAGGLLGGALAYQTTVRATRKTSQGKARERELLELEIAILHRLEAIAKGTSSAEWK